jgi:hypothetical protein
MRERYEKAKEEYVEQLSELRNSAKASPEYKHMMESYHAIGVETDDVDIKTHRKKKRRLLKGLKQQYTGQKGEESAFRGWSARAYADMASHSVAIKKEPMMYQRFDNAYRQVYAVMNTNPNSEKATEQLVSDLDYNELFDFPSVSV